MLPSAVSVDDVVTVEFYAELSRAMFASACDFARQTHGRKDQVQLAMATVIMSQATLEAFLNEDLEQFRWARIRGEAHGQAWDVVIEALGRASLEQRWLVFPQLRWGVTFDRSREPFQSFRGLVALRNHLVHYAPRSGPILAVPKKLASLSSRFAFTEPSNVMWPRLILNASCARWACRTTQAMIQEYCRLGGDSDPWQAIPSVDGTAPPIASLWPEPPPEPEPAPPSTD